jgi:hypothetical protein
MGGVSPGKGWVGTGGAVGSGGIDVGTATVSVGAGRVGNGGTVTSTVGVGSEIVCEGSGRIVLPGNGEMVGLIAVALGVGEVIGAVGVGLATSAAVGVGKPGSAVGPATFVGIGVRVGNTPVVAGARLGIAALCVGEVFPVGVASCG